MQAAKSEKRYLVVGIGGCSSAGKSTLAYLINKEIPNAIVIYMDEYYFDESYENHCKIAEYDGFINWDVLDSVDFSSLIESLDNIINNRKHRPSIDGHLKPTLSTFPSLDKSKDTERSFCTNIDISEDFAADIKAIVDSKCTIVFVEGILTLDYQPLENYFDLKYFLTLTEEEALDRRVKRKFEEPSDYFSKYAWPAYIHSLNSLSSDVKLLNGLDCVKENCGTILCDIKNKLINTTCK